MTEKNVLATKAVDRTIVGLKGVLGAIPVVGSLVAEVVADIIPNQRVDRIADFTKRLSDRIDEQSRVLLQNRIVQPEGADIIEEALWQSARALSDERRERIAALTKNALTREELNLVESKKIFLLLSQLNDFELVLLRSYTESKDSEFMRTHAKALASFQVYIGAPKELMDKHAVWESMRDHLVGLGLINPWFKAHTYVDMGPGHARQPVGYNISLLGRLLLRSVDFYPVDDKFYENQQEIQIAVTGNVIEGRPITQ